MVRFSHPAFVGFDRLFDELEGSMNAPSYPPHNLVKLEDDKYRLELAVAGYSESDINVSLEQGQLVISGNKPDDKSDYIHRGISRKNFKKSFRLHEDIEVKNAQLVDGMLSIDLEHVIPEEKRPKTIPISSGPQQLNE